MTDLRKLAAAASPGPWYQFDHGGKIDDTRYYGEGYAGAVWGPKGPGYGIITMSREDFDTDRENAAYIAAANPQAILALLDERDALTARVAELEAALNEAALYAGKE
jgi:hypothetical protein